MSLVLKDWNGHPLDKGFYEHTEKGTLFFIRKKDDKYFISSKDEKERELKGLQNQHYRMLRVCPHDYLERMYQEARETQEFITSKNEADSH